MDVVSIIYKKSKICKYFSNLDEETDISSFLTKNVHKNNCLLSKKYFSDGVERFIWNIRDSLDIHNVFISHNDLADLQIVNLTIYYDLDPPDMNKIKIIFDKDDE